jgi:hypothetical protein
MRDVAGRNVGFTRFERPRVTIDRQLEQALQNDTGLFVRM